jgi:AcrR family transcriptional regulator
VKSRLRKPAEPLEKEPVHWRRLPEARHQDILDAALAVFAEKGFSAARMQELAKRAGISQGTLYLYFASKEEIFKSLVAESIGPQISTLAQAAREFKGPTPDLIRLVMRAIFAFMLSSNRAVLPKLIIAETGNFPELARFYKTEVTDRMLAIFEGMVRRGMERGEFREIDPKHGGRLVFQPAMFAAIWRASFGAFDSEPYDYQGLIETHLDVVLRGFAAEKMVNLLHLESSTA